jgi:phosphohistidine phosphatase
MKLWLIRHAKSEWKSAAVTDFERPLDARGERDGACMAAWLARQSDPASWIWSSDAVRASSTAGFVADGFISAGARVVEDHRLYDAGPERLLEVIRETPPQVTSAAVVAHNPGMTVLVNLLAGRNVTDDLPTFGLARLEVPGPWAALAVGRGRLELLTGPRRLDGEAV